MYIDKIPKMILGNQTAIIGLKSDCSAITPNILSKNTKTIEIQIPIARLTPIPPRRFIEETATAIIVNMNTETGKLHFLYNTNLNLPTFEDPLASSFSIKRYKSPYILVSAA